MNYTKQFITYRLSLVFIIIILFSLSGIAQDLEEEFKEFQKEINEEFNQTSQDQESEFKAFLKNTNEEFYSFLDNSNKEFIEFLKNEWVEINGFSYNNYDKSKKPEFEDVYNQKNYSAHKYTIESELEINPISKAWLNSYYTIQDNPVDIVFKKIEFDYYGTKLTVSYDPSILSVLYTGSDNKEVANFWEKASKTNLAKTLVELNEIKENLNLYDWAFYKLIDKAFDEIFTDNNNRLLFKWYILNRAGYDVKLGSDNNSLFLLLGSNNKVYNTPYFEIKNRNYIVINGNPNKLKTYPNNYLHGRPFSFHQYSPINLPYKPGHKKVEFSFNSRDYSFKIPYNKNLVDLYKDYPLTEFSIYANSFVSSETKNYLFTEIQTQLSLISKDKQLDFLNTFVQSTNKYKTDIEQFGHEKILFPEESLFYEYSDCEDRVILLAYFIKNLLHTNSIAVDFKGHVVVGLPSDETNIASSLTLNGKHYALIDPAYKGAPAGLVSPKLTSENPGIINLYETNPFNSENNLTKVLNKNCVLENIYTNKKGVVYYAGYVLNEFEINNIHLSPIENSSNSFLIQQLPNQKLNLLIPPKADDFRQIHAVSENSTGDLYVLGSFIDSIEFENKKLKTSTGDMFLLKLNSIKQVSWLKKLNLSKVADSIPNFLTILNSKGDLKYLGKQAYRQKQNAFQIEFDTANNCIIQGGVAFSGLLNVDTLFFETGNTFEIIDWLIKENSRLIKAKFNPGISPLFAIANMISSSNISLSGAVLDAALKEMSKEKFKNDENYLKNISNIESISRQHGFVNITTETGTPVYFQNLEISNNALLKIAEEDLESRILIYSGLKWGHAANWHKVNYILIQKRTGEILYDYDQHYRNKIPARQITIQ